MSTRSRIYSDKERAHALAVLDVCDGDASKASRKLKIPRRTLAEWQSGRIARVSIASVRQEEKNNLADAFEEVAWKCVTRLTKSDIIDECTRPSELSTVAGTAVDKMRLLRGEAPPGQDAETTRRIIEQAIASLIALTAQTNKPLTPDEAVVYIREMQLTTHEMTLSR